MAAISNTSISGMSGSPLVYRDPNGGDPSYLGYLLGGPAINIHYLLSILCCGINEIINLYSNKGNQSEQ